MALRLVCVFEAGEFQLDLVAIKKQLQTRGIVVRPPADSNLLGAIEKRLGRPLETQFRSVYEAFDGFEEMDPRSLLNIWPAKKVLSNFDCSDTKHSEEYFAFGDFLINTDFLVYPRGSAAGSICYDVDLSVVANSFSAFFKNLLAGEYDILDD